MYVCGYLIHYFWKALMKDCLLVHHLLLCIMISLTFCLNLWILWKAFVPCPYLKMQCVVAALCFCMVSPFPFLLWWTEYKTQEGELHHCACWKYRGTERHGLYLVCPFMGLIKRKKKNLPVREYNVTVYLGWIKLMNVSSDVRAFKHLDSCIWVATDHPGILVMGTVM